MIDWRLTKVAPERTHHIANGEPIYETRFDEVLSFHEPGLAAVHLGASAWHITPSGDPAYTRRFSRAFGFYDGRAAVVDERGAFHISALAVDLYSERYAWCGNFQGGRCVVRESDGGYKHIDAHGHDVYSARWKYAGDFREGTAVVMSERGLCTHIREDGSLLHGAWLLDLDVFHKGLARARDAEGWTHIDRSGQPVYAPRFTAVEPFYNGQARVVLADGHVAVIDEDGVVVVVPSASASKQCARSQATRSST